MQKQPTENDESPKSLELPQADHEFIRVKSDRDGHIWAQHGSIVTCNSCAEEHGFSIPTDSVLTGIGPDGYPKIERV